MLEVRNILKQLKLVLRGTSAQQEAEYCPLHTHTHTPHSQTPSLTHTHTLNNTQRYNCLKTKENVRNFYIFVYIQGVPRIMPVARRLESRKQSLILEFISDIQSLTYFNMYDSYNNNHIILLALEFLKCGQPFLPGQYYRRYE